MQAELERLGLHTPVRKQDHLDGHQPVTLPNLKRDTFRDYDGEH